MKKLVVVLMASAVVALSGCASIGRTSPQYSVQANTDGRVGGHTGTSRSYYLFWGLLQWGDSGVVAAAKDSGGKFICTVDRSDFTFFGIFGEHSTIVTTDDAK